MKRVRHLVSPFDCTGKRVLPADRQWTRCGRLLYHVVPQPKGAPACQVCERVRASTTSRKGAA